MTWRMSETQTPPGLQRVAPARSLAERVVDRLKAEYLSGALQPGDRLPTEQALGRMLGVSRTVVREAIAALKADGLVETRQGRGASVAGDPHRQPFRVDAAALSSIEMVVRLMELRMAVEVEAAAAAAANRTPAQLAEIERALARIEAAVERGDAAVDEDFDFHLKIALATGNPYFAEFLRFLGRLIIPRQSVRVGLDEGEARRRYLRRVQREHRRIVERIAAGSPQGARAAMRRHLSNSRQRYRRLAARRKGEA
jgi:GntR family transcriptional regulator, transcriptional repressor for pyruvate dehydrogenase complex